jgi:riboflavin synthase
MFTGIVTAMGEVERAERSTDRLALTVRAPYDDVKSGDSIAVNGACLTVVQTDGRAFRVDVIVTTRGRTSLEALRPGDRVNLERPLGVGDRFGGHFVQGHVDGLAEVLAIHDVADARLVDLRLPADVAELSVPRGSIALDGVSLTINAILSPDTIQVALIPYTLDETTLGRWQVGDRVQVEGDMLGKYVRRLLRKDA